MLAQGIMRPSTSPWAAPAILVPKKSPDGKSKYRFCVDFRALKGSQNLTSTPCQFSKEQPLHCMSPNTFRFRIAIAGFGRWHKEEHRDRAGFAVLSGQYEFKRLPFWLVEQPRQLSEADGHFSKEFGRYRMLDIYR